MKQGFYVKLLMYYKEIEAIGSSINIRAFSSPSQRCRNMIIAEGEMFIISRSQKVRNEILTARL